MSKILLFQAIQFRQTVLIQTIQFSIRISSCPQTVKTVLFQIIQFNTSTVLMSKTVLFQIIQFSMCTQFSTIWPIDRILSVDTDPDPSRPRSDGNEGILLIRQSFNITGISLSDCSLSYPGHSFGGGSYHSAEMQSMYYTAPADLENQY